MKTFSRISVLAVFVWLLSTATGASQNNGFVSLSIDPLMMTQGPYSDSSKGELDFIIRAASEKGKHSEYGVYYECFQVIKYHGYGVFYNYKLTIEDNAKQMNKWEFAIGPELGLIQRYVEGSTLNLNTAINGEIRYFFKNGENTYFDKISTCVLKNMNVDYGGDIFSSFDDGIPVEINLTLQFQELELLTKERIAQGY